MYLACGLMLCIQVAQFGQQCFTPCLLGATWQAPLDQLLTQYVSKHLLGDTRVHTMHDANANHVSCETMASAQSVDS